MQTLQVMVLVASILGSLGFGSVLTSIVNGFTKNSKRKRQMELKETVADTVSIEIQPVKADVAELRENIKKLNDADKSQRSGIQAILRDRLYQLYRFVATRGYTTQEDRDNFHNMYEKYHSLGGNGCMNVTKQKFDSLPTEEEFAKKSHD